MWNISMFVSECKWKTLLRLPVFNGLCWSVTNEVLIMLEKTTIERRNGYPKFFSIINNITAKLGKLSLSGKMSSVTKEGCHNVMMKMKQRCCERCQTVMKGDVYRMLQWHGTSHDTNKVHVSRRWRSKVLLLRHAPPWVLVGRVLFLKARDRVMKKMHPGDPRGAEEGRWDDAGVGCCYYWVGDACWDSFFPSLREVSSLSHGLAITR